MVNLSNANDDEVLENIQESFEEDGRLNTDYIDIEVVNGSVTLSGRVVSEDELQIIDELLEQLGIENYKNKVWVDENLGFEEGEEDDGKFRGLSFDDDDEIEEQDYSGEDDDEEEMT